MRLQYTKFRNENRLGLPTFYIDPFPPSPPLLPTTPRNLAPCSVKTSRVFQPLSFCARASTRCLHSLLLN